MDTVLLLRPFEHLWTFLHLSSPALAYNWLTVMGSGGGWRQGCADAGERRAASSRQ